MCSTRPLKGISRRVRVSHFDKTGGIYYNKLSMLKQTSLLWALNFSLVGHVSVFLLASSHFNPADRIIPKTEDVEITYFEIRDVPEWGNIPQSKNEEKVSIVQAAPPALPPPAPASIPLPPERGKPSYPIEIPKPGNTCRRLR